jgi:GNAT superfamily N-acetyltransferase
MTEPTLAIRPARRDDLPVVVGLHAQDAIGRHGDAWSDAARPGYEAALARLTGAQGHTLYVAEVDGEVVGTFVLSILPGLTEQGRTIALLRSVQVAPHLRSRGLGSRMIGLAEDAARAAGASRIELTSNGRRLDAHRFYERLGYVHSHAGFKKPLGG